MNDNINRVHLEQWKKPEIQIIDLAACEQEILANARSGGHGCIGACSWRVGCDVLL